MNTKETTSTQKLAIARCTDSSCCCRKSDQRSCCRKQMCSGPAYGQCLCSSHAWPMVGNRHCFLCKSDPQPARNRQSSCLSRKHGWRLMLWSGLPTHPQIKSYLCCRSTGNRNPRSLAAYPVAKLLMGLAPAGFTVYMIPFFISTFTGSVLAFILLRVFEKSQVFLAARR